MSDRQLLERAKSPWPREHPLHIHVMMGGRPWMKRGALKVERLYFDQFASRGWEWFVQGNEAWKRQGPAQFPMLTDDQIAQFPIGHFDIPNERWVIKDWLANYWPGNSYQEFMNAAIARRTFAPMVPPAEVRTRDGLLMEPGLEVMFVGGKVLHRHHFDITRLLGRRMIAWCRAGNWHYKPNGLVKTYGDDYIRVRERASPSEPKAWWVVPFEGDPLFVIPSRSFDGEFSWLPIEDPEVSLVTIDGRRLILPMPAPTSTEPLIPA